MTRAVLIGATGMVGQAVIARYGSLSLVPLARRALDPPFAGAICAVPGDWAEYVAAQAPDVLICCLGTTIKAAGSRAAFRAIDLDLVLDVARGASAGGTRHMIVVSSVGAAAASGSFYLQIKGEMEAGLRHLPFARLDIMRPGLLTGQRDGPTRPGEALAMLAAPVTDALLHGPMRKYRSISAHVVAQSMVALAVGGGIGAHVHHHDAMLALVRG